jgi:hypothetical protein
MLGQIARIAKIHFGAITHDNGHPPVAVPATLARASGGNRNSSVRVFQARADRAVIASRS